MHRMLRSLAVTSITLALAGCGSSREATLGDDFAEVAVTVSAVGTLLDTVVITVTAPDIPTALVFNLMLQDGAATRVLRVPPGPKRTITVQAFDSNGDLFAEGSEIRDVERGSNNIASFISLMTVPGVFPIFVSVGPVSIRIHPPSAVLAVGESVWLVPNVRAVDDSPVGEPVEWATANPGIATVTQDGLVTAILPGDTAIVAVSVGVAAAIPVTVLPTSAASSSCPGCEVGAP